MQNQIEAKFLNVNLEETRHHLASMSAKLSAPMRLMISVVLDYPDHYLRKKQQSWVRVRQEGDKITLTYKEVLEGVPAGAKQIEIVIHSLEHAVEFLQKLGLNVVSIQESRRETWQIGEVDVMLYEWPWVKPYVQVEGPSEAAIRDVAARLGMAWSQSVFGSSTIVYAAEYPGITLERADDIAQIPKIKFGAPLPDWLAERKNS